MAKISFVMGPYRGGGPRNVYSLSNLISKHGYISEVDQFIDSRYFNFLKENSMKADHNGAIVKTPGFISTLTNATFELINRVPNAFITPLLPLSILSRAMSLKRYGDADVYVATDWGSVYPTKIIAENSKSKILYFVQAYEPQFSNDTIYKLLAKNTYKLPIVRVTQSMWLKSFLDREFGGTTHYIGFGLNEKFFLGKSENTENVLFTIARDSYNKGFDIFVKAVNSLWEKRKDFKIMIAGDKIAIDHNEIRFPYDFLGWITDDKKLASIYQKAIFVHTGRCEALPMPVLEAMASGSSVVLNDINGNREFAIPFKNCLMSALSDDQSLVQNIEFLLDNPTVRRKISEGGQLTANNYKWELVLQRFLNVLKMEFGL